jgi:pSer/pThr/pTyr-binding forkhead associated (FHA) protein
MSPDAATVLGTWLVGSDASCDIVVADRAVSARHCRLTRFTHGFTL